jgi:hypothetical protein
LKLKLTYLDNILAKKLEFEICYVNLRLSKVFEQNKGPKTQKIVRAKSYGQTMFVLIFLGATVYKIWLRFSNPWLKNLQLVDWLVGFAWNTPHTIINEDVTVFLTPPAAYSI